eukprot:XP_014787539.1 PREDICTED: protein fuzzy homolog [Octopus bimaculoides]
MAACSLMCLTTCGGVPLFTRNKGTKRPLPFPLIGTLNGVQMFAASRDMELQSTTTENSKVFWKVFQNRIYSSSHCTELCKDVQYENEKMQNNLNGSVHLDIS